jgi:hypothetical protein
MLERFTEKARRVLQLARTSASNAGAMCIESQHLLLGILKETPSVIQDQFPQKLEQIKSELAGQEVKGSKASDLGLPLSNECKRILAYAAEEAERLAHRHIGTEHLFLGVLREEKSMAAKLLQSHGIRVQDERLRIARDAELHGVTSKRVDELAAPGVGPGVIVGRVASAGRRIEFRSESDDSVLGTAPGREVPRLGDEISLGELQGRVTRVVHQYTPTPEGGPMVPQRIAVYLSLGPQYGS